MRSRAAPETSTFDRWLRTVAEAMRGREFPRSLDVVCELAAERFGARLRFVKMIGRRWSYIAGYYSQTPAASCMERIPLGGSIGLVSDCWGTLAGSARARLLDFLCETVSLGTAGMRLTRDEIALLIEHGGEDLLAEADAARREYCGDVVHLRGIIEFSNVCSRNCAYCGLRKENDTLPRYTMSADEILRVVAEADREDVRTIVLQSGEYDACRSDWLAEVIAAIKHRFDVAVTLCVGAKRERYYHVWRQAGADRCLIKHETANTALYETFHPDSQLHQRLAAIECLRALGYQIGTGNIIGLPGQTSCDLASDILLTRKLDVDMAAFGSLVPHPMTPLAHTRTADIELSLRVVAAARLVLGAVHIPATTAFDAVAPDGRERALRAGANVIMANLTPPRYTDFYEIYPTRRATNTVARVKAMLARLGRLLATDHGHSLKRIPEAELCGKPPRA